MSMEALAPKRSPWLPDLTAKKTFNLSELVAEPGLYMEASLPDERGASSYQLDCKLSPEQECNHFMGSDKTNERGDCIYKETVHQFNGNSLSGSQEERYQEHVVPFPYDGEVDKDVGYSSHSTCSSCHVDSIQMDQGSQVGFGPSSLNIDWSDVECEDGCLHGENEVEDLLYHFDRFFRNRLDGEMQRLQNSIHSMLTEQQIHVRQIVNTAVKSCHDQVSSETLQQDNFHDNSIKKAQLQSLSLPQTECEDINNKPPHSPITTSLLQSSPFCQNISLTSDCLKRENTQNVDIRKLEDGENIQLQSKDKLLLRLLSLVCGISSLLQRKEYRT